MKHHPQRYYLLLLILIMIIPVFGTLDKMLIRLWDESRLAMNAYEMSKSGNWWVTTFGGEPDMWNTKPPLLIWIQALFIKTFGFNVLSLRMPVAIAVAITLIYIFRTIGKHLKDHLLGFIAALILLTTNGYIIEHVGRTGDYYGMLILFTTISGLSFFNFLRTEQKRYCYLFFITLCLAVLTKGIAGLLFLPALFLYTLFKKRTIYLLKQKEFYLGLLIFMMPVICYYCVRACYNPGYFEAVIKNELGGRFLETLENHDYPFLFYYDLIRTQYFSYWLVLFVIGSFVGIRHRSLYIRDLTLFALLATITFFLVISSAQTKLMWYAAPIFPFMSIIAALPVYRLVGYLKNDTSFKKNTVNYVIAGALLAIFIIPYCQTIAYTTEREGDPNAPWVYNKALLIKNALAGNIDLEHCKVLITEYEPHVLLYIYMAAEKGLDISKVDIQDIRQGDRIITDKDDAVHTLESSFELAIEYQNDNVRIINIKNKKAGLKPAY